MSVEILLFSVLLSILYLELSNLLSSSSKKFTLEKQDAGEFVKNRRWTEEETLIASYVATYYKTTNSDLLENIAKLIGRDKSALVRKISRLRAVLTDKAPYASRLDIDTIIKVSTMREEEARLTFLNCLTRFNFDKTRVDHLLNTSLKIN